MTAAGTVVYTETFNEPQVNTVTTILTHPDNVEHVMTCLREIGKLRNEPDPMRSLAGEPIRIQTSKFMEREKRTWVPPADDRFVTYEQKDHPWLQRLGFGHWAVSYPAYWIADTSPLIGLGSRLNFYPQANWERSPAYVIPPVCPGIRT